MIQTEYGISRRWYWPFIAPFKVQWRKGQENEQTLTDDVEAALPDLPHAMASSTHTDSEPKGDKLNVSTLIQDEASGSKSVARGIGNETTALQISSASKRFGKNYSVRNISFSVSSGEILALLGPNGAGKTTLLNCILGLYRLSSGRVEIQGYNIQSHQDQVYRYIGICPQQEILWPELTAEEHLLFYCRLKGIPPKDEKEVVKQCLEQVELLPEQRKLSKHLSGGQRRRLAIGIAIVAKPMVVFLDEPTTGTYTPLPTKVTVRPRSKHQKERSPFLVSN